MKLLLPILLLTVSGFQSSITASLGFDQMLSRNASMLYGEALEAVFTMGLRLQAIMDTSSDENFVVSPLSTTAIIAQMMIGANGEFREQLHDLLSLPTSTSSFNVTHYSKDGNESQILPYAKFHLQLALLIKELRRKKAGQQFTLNLDNALFYNENVDLKSVFIASLDKIYDTDVTPMDFRKDSTKIINDWASKHTNGLISSFLSSRLPSSTASLFLNSIYFLAEWETPFADFLNNEDDFQVTDTNSVKTMFMMGNILDIPFTETKNYKLVCLPYKDRAVGMYIISPNINHEYKYNIKKFAESINPQEILTSLNKMKPHDVTVKIPKLSLSNSLSILKPLQKYVIFEKMNKLKPHNPNAIDDIIRKVQDFKNFTVPLNEDIYLENASKGVPLRVSDIVQQMVFSINEKGTEAAAVSGGITDYMGGAKTLVLNRPFSFFIRHEKTQAILFWGTISNPTKN